MTDEYHKIQTVFKRDPETKYKTLLEGEYSRPEFELLKDIPWVYTEKVDGTNIRVRLSEYGVEFAGRTDRADIQPNLQDALEEIFPVRDYSDVFEPGVVATLYGEGYGPKIQKGGGRYREDASFVLFDVAIGGMFLSRENVEDIANGLGIDVVPEVLRGNLQDGIEYCRQGFTSEWGDFEAEGLIGRPAVELRNRRGQRIITKIKCGDFER